MGARHHGGRTGNRPLTVALLALLVSSAIWGALSGVPPAHATNPSIHSTAQNINENSVTSIGTSTLNLATGTSIIVVAVEYGCEVNNCDISATVSDTVGNSYTLQVSTYSNVTYSGPITWRFRTEIWSAVQTQSATSTVVIADFSGTSLTPSGTGIQAVDVENLASVYASAVETEKGPCNLHPNCPNSITTEAAASYIPGDVFFSATLAGSLVTVGTGFNSVVYESPYLEAMGRTVATTAGSTDFPFSATSPAYWVDAGAVFGPSPFPPSTAIGLDASNVCYSSAATSVSCTIKTTSPEDVILAELGTASGASGITISDTAGLVWTKRTAIGGASTNATEYYAKSPNALSVETVTASWTNERAATLILVAVANANYSAPFDSSAPWTSSGSNSAPSVSSVATSKGGVLVLDFAVVDGGSPYPIGPAAPCTADTGFTMIGQGLNTLAADGAAQYNVSLTMWAGSPSFGSCDTASWAGIVDALVGLNNAGVSFTALITNMDAGNYVVAAGTYDFRAVVTNSSISGGNGTVDKIQIQFYDGSDRVEMSWTNSSGVESYTLASGSDIVSLATGSASTAADMGNSTTTVDFPVTFGANVPSAADVDLYLLAAKSGGATRGFEVVQAAYFNIMGAGGGIVTKTFTGNATGGTGGCTDCVTVGYGGKASVNSTWYGLQQYDAQFAITLSDNNFTKSGATWTAPASLPGDPYLFQDYHNWFSSDPTYAVPGSWNVTVSWYYWDGASWVSGEHVVITMYRGNQGSADEWVTLGVAWYQGNTLVTRAQNVTAWIENGATSAGGQNTAEGQVRIFVDLWLSNSNSSETMGGHVSAYYFGMHDNTFLWWGSWSPTFENSSISQVLLPLENHAGGVISASTVLFSKISYVVARDRPASGSASETTCSTGVSTSCRFFTVSLHNFDEEQYVVAPASGMEGVNTPLFVAPQVPQLPSSGFLSPLYAALTALASGIWKALASALAAIWAALGSQFPWFTGFLSWVYGGMVAFYAILAGVGSYLLGFLGFLAGAVSYVQGPISVIEDAWGFVLQMLRPFIGPNTGQIILLYVIIVFGLDMADAAAKGDTAHIVGLARQVWRTLEAILRWTWNFAQFIISNIAGLIP